MRRNAALVAIGALASVPLLTATPVQRASVVDDFFDWADVPHTIAKVKRYIVLAPYRAGGPRTYGEPYALLTSKVLDYRDVRRYGPERAKALADALAEKQLRAALRGDWANVGPNTLWVSAYDTLPCAAEDLG